MDDPDLESSIAKRPSFHQTDKSELKRNLRRLHIVPKTRESAGRDGGERHLQLYICNHAQEHTYLARIVE